ncbi:MAG: hypothetical protein ABI780_04775 [Ardenticatenales bacterium]
MSERVGDGEAVDAPIDFDAVCAAERASLGVGPDAPLAALCLSGGGIRSAAFSLGVVTGLARAGVLGGFHYLSTVSGGGYTGGWLRAWIQRTGSRRRVIEALRWQDAAPREGDVRTLDPKPVRHVRAYCSYLSPHWGLTSADAWTLLGTYLRNLVITAVVLVPLMAAVLMVPWANVALFGAVAACVNPTAGAASGCGGLTPAQVRLLLFVLSGALTAFGIAALRVQGEGTDDGNRRLVDRLNRHLRDNGDADLVRYFIAPITLASIVLIWLLMTYPRCSGWRCYAPMALWGAIVHWIGRSLGGAALVLGRRGTLSRAHGRPLLEVVPVIVSGMIGGAGCRFLAMQLQSVTPSDGRSGFWLEATLGPPLLLIIGLVAATVFVGLVSYASSEHDREFWSRSGSWFLVMIVVLLVGHGIALYSLPALHALSAHRDTLVLTVWGAVTGSLTAAARFNPSSGGGEGAPAPKGAIGKATELLTFVAAPLFLLQVLVAVAAMNAFILRSLPTSLPPALTVVIASVLLLVAGLGAGWLVKLDEFSLHAMYNNRLTRTFLGASRLEGADIRHPDPFTGFDPEDDMPLFALAEPLPSGEPRRLLHVINMALNIGRGVDLADQHRKAVPFSATCLHAGARRIGYRSMLPAELDSAEAGSAKAGSTEAGSTRAPRRSTKAVLRNASYLGQRGTGYGGKDGLSLGTAMTISGAAASPNMGFHTSAIISFILTLLNIRLGRWLGNTGPAGAASYATPGPRVSSLPIVQEAFRITGVDRPYVFLSDGGHFENLGLYEMVMRRCRLIVVADASADPKYLGGDIARAVQLIRLDLSVPITFHEPASSSHVDAATAGPNGNNRSGERPIDHPAAEPSNAPPRPPWRYRFATIHYADRFAGEPDGVLVVLKPAVFEDDPPDVRHLRNQSDHFPHDSTANQWFTEEQFEGYRMLGEQTVAAFGAGPAVAVSDVGSATFGELAAWLGRAGVDIAADNGPRNAGSRVPIPPHPS